MLRELSKIRGYLYLLWFRLINWRNDIELDFTHISPKTGMWEFTIFCFKCNKILYKSAEVRR